VRRFRGAYEEINFCSSLGIASWNCQLLLFGWWFGLMAPVGVDQSKLNVFALGQARFILGSATSAPSCHLTSHQDQTQPKKRQKESGSDTNRKRVPNKTENQISPALCDFSICGALEKHLGYLLTYY